MTGKKTFVKISTFYAVVLIVCCMVTSLFYDPTEYVKYWMLFLVTTLLLTVGYFQFLQIRFKRIESSVVSIAGVCIMGGLGSGIIILLIVGVSTFQPYMLTFFSGLNMIGAIWFANRLWIKAEKRG